MSPYHFSVPQRNTIRKNDIWSRLCLCEIIIMLKCDEATEFPDTEIKTYALYADPDGRRPVRKTSQTKPTKSTKKTKYLNKKATWTLQDEPNQI
jgi:hypothetical protein